MAEKNKGKESAQCTHSDDITCLWNSVGLHADKNLSNLYFETDEELNYNFDDLHLFPEVLQSEDNICKEGGEEIVDLYCREWMPDDDSDGEIKLIDPELAGGDSAAQEQQQQRVISPPKHNTCSRSKVPAAPRDLKVARLPPKPHRICFACLAPSKTRRRNRRLGRQKTQKRPSTKCTTAVTTAATQSITNVSIKSEVGKASAQTPVVLGEKRRQSNNEREHQRREKIIDAFRVLSEKLPNLLHK